jgi:hypothetical protein
VGALMLEVIAFTISQPINEPGYAAKREKNSKE